MSETAQKSVYNVKRTEDGIDSQNRWLLGIQSKIHANSRAKFMEEGRFGIFKPWVGKQHTSRYGRHPPWVEKKHICRIDFRDILIAHFRGWATGNHPNLKTAKNGWIYGWMNEWIMNEGWMKDEWRMNEWKYESIGWLMDVWMYENNYRKMDRLSFW